MHRPSRPLGIFGSFREVRADIGFIQVQQRHEVVLLVEGKDETACAGFRFEELLCV